MPQIAPRSILHQRLQMQALGTEKISRTSKKLLVQVKDFGEAAGNFATRISAATEAVGAKTGELSEQTKQMGIQVGGIKTELEKISLAIGNLGTKPGDEVFVGYFFSKALTPAGQINTKDPVGVLFCNAGVGGLADIYKLTSFKPGSAQALLRQLVNANPNATTPPLPTLLECKALLQALRNIFGDYAPGAPPIDGGDTGPTTTAA